MGLDSVELVLATEQEFGIDIEDAAAANLTTPRLLADHVVARLAVMRAGEPRRPPTRGKEWSPDEVLQRILQLTSRQLGIPMDKIHPDHHFVKDLGID